MTKYNDLMEAGRALVNLEATIAQAEAMRLSPSMVAKLRRRYAVVLRQWRALQPQAEAELAKS